MVAHSVVYNGTPIEKMNGPELIAAMEAVCGQLQECKEGLEYWKEKCKTNTEAAYHAEYWEEKYRDKVRNGT